MPNVSSSQRLATGDAPARPPNRSVEYGFECIEPAFHRSKALPASVLPTARLTSMPSRQATPTAAPVIGDRYHHASVAGHTTSMAQTFALPLPTLTTSVTRGPSHEGPCALQRKVDEALGRSDDTRAVRQGAIDAYERVLLPKARFTQARCGTGLFCGLTQKHISVLKAPILVRFHDHVWIYEEAAFLRWWLAFGTYPDPALHERKLATLALYRPEWARA